MCSVHAERFPQNRSLTTGSWLGRAHQGRDLGKEMRRAALHLILAGFDADLAVTGAWHDNAASLAVTRSLPYTETGTTVEDRRDDIRLVDIGAVRGQLRTQR